MKVILCKKPLLNTQIKRGNKTELANHFRKNIIFFSAEKYKKINEKYKAE
jgi:hypothetical protein